MNGIAIGIKYKRKAVKYIRVSRISGIYRVKLVKYGVRWGVYAPRGRERRVRWWSGLNELKISGRRAPGRLAPAAARARAARRRRAPRRFAPLRYFIK